MQRGPFFGLVALVVVAVGVAAYYEHWMGGPAPTPSSVAGSASPAPTPAVTPVPAATAPSPPPQAVQATPPATLPVVPSFDVVRVDPTGAAVIAGRSEPSAEVTVLDGEKPLTTITADKNGEWVLTLDTPLSPGNHELGLSTKSAADGTVRKSDNVVVVAVPDRGKTQTAGGAPQQPLAVLVPRGGQGLAKALQVPTPPPSSDAETAALPSGASAGTAPPGQALPIPPVVPGPASASHVLVIDVVQYDGVGHLGVSGRAPPGGRVLVYLDNAPIGDAHADQKGDWTTKANDPVAVGRYTLRSDLVAPDGKVTARVVLHFRRVEVPAQLANNQFLVVQPGNSLWRIARHVYGLGPLFTDIYQANRSEITDPNVIYPDQVMKLPPG